jgi:hypothetical protein
MRNRTHGENKYSSLPPKALPKFGHFGEPIRDDVVQVKISPAHTRSLNFAILNGRPQLKKTFLSYYRLLGAKQAPLTKVIFFGVLKGFVRFLDDYEPGNDLEPTTTFDIDTHFLLDFRLWLETRPALNSYTKEPTANKLSASTVVGTYRNFLFMLKAARALDPDLFPNLPRTLRLGRPANVHVKPAKDLLTPDDLARILAAAESDVKIVRQNNKEIRAMLERTKNRPIEPLLPKTRGYWRSMENTVHSVIRENGLLGPPPETVKRILTSCHRTCPTELMRKHVPVGESSLLPFALILYIRTALNVSSLLTLTRDCVSSFPLPQYRRLSYDKPRSGASRSQSQILPAKISKPSEHEDPIEVIEFLLNWTEPLLKHTPDRLRKFLFIYKTTHIGPVPGRFVRPLPPLNPFAHGLVDFVSRHRETHQLPNFSLGDLRPAVASYLYLKTKNIRRVQRFLGHRSILTTIRYIRGRIVAKEHDKSMAGAIHQTLQHILSSDPSLKNAGKKPSRNLPILATVIETTKSGAPGPTDDPSSHGLSITDLESIKQSGVMVLVARCRAPENPPEFLKVPEGKICTKIFKCLSCPNSVVLEEDLPKVVLRIQQIWAERERLTSEGWHILYEDAWLALNQVVRLFSPAAQQAAIAQVNDQMLIGE